ncbi:MAG: glycoside hydrolase [Kiritimatiellae bacterium]|nr:glycoside hydrolase [Kiritimatiellia bacterium]
MNRTMYVNRMAIIVSAISLLSGMWTLGAAPFVSEIPLRDGERWWGGGGGDGQNQPYGAGDTRRIDLRTHGNTASPLLISSSGRYVWSEKPFAYAFQDGKLILDSDVESITPVEAGTTLKDAYLAAAKAHMRFDGRTPPDVFFALPQWNNWIEIFLHGMDQKAADDYTAELAKSGFPCGIYMMDGGWLSHQGSYEFYEKDFPDPKRLFARITAQGWIPLIWTAHFVSPDSREYKRLRYHKKLNGLDYLAYRKKPGSKEAAVVRWWSGISAIYDLTKPAARDYYVKTLREFAAKYGIKGFKFDAGDPHFFAEDCRFADEKAEPVDYTRLYAELAANEFPYHEIRVSWKCGGLPLVTRLGDRAHSWTGSRGQDTVVPQIITAGLLGCPYSLADMVGGGLEVSFVEREIDEKLFVRSAALQSLMPMMQFSPAPWRHLSAEGVKLCRSFADLHIAFAPYILTVARHAAATGEPIVRAMEYEFPHQGFTRPMQQFMLGDRWLVAPVITPDDAKTVELPPGKWRDDLGTLHEGPKTLHLTHVPLNRLPRYERLAATP